jgi:PAS domain S-box-containing protein
MNSNVSTDDLREENRRLKEELEKIKKAQPSIFQFTGQSINSTNQLIALSNLETGEYVDVNQAFLSVLGYTREEVIGKTSDDIQLYVDIIQNNKFIKLLSKLHKVKDFEVTLRKRDSDEKSFLFSAETVFLHDQIFLLTFYYDVSALNAGYAKAESEKVIREVFDSTSSYFAIFRSTLESSFIVLDFNTHAEEVEQLDRDEVLGKDITDTPFISNEPLLTLLHKVYTTGIPQRMPLSHSNNSDDGFYIGMLISTGDIIVTWEAGRIQKERENEIIRQGIVFETFAEMLPEIIMETDISGRVTFMNTQGLLTLGYNNTDLSNGICLSDLLSGEDMIKLNKELGELVSPAQITFSEYKLLNNSGNHVTVLFHAGSIFTRKKITGYRCVLTDISKHKNYETQLLTEKAFLEHIIDASPEAIVLTDFDNHIIKTNKSFTSLFGYTGEEAINKVVDDLLVPEDLKEEAFQVDQEAMLKGTEEYQTIRIDRNGNRIFVSMILSTVKVNNEPVAFIAIYRDVSKERKAKLMQEIQYNISAVTLQDFDIFDIYPTIVKEISRLWNVNNFFIALFNKEKDTLTFPFFADERDHFQETTAKNTLTGWVIKSNKSALLKDQDIIDLENSGVISLVGSPCKVWMGVPMRVDTEVIGAICLQDYKSSDAFNYDDLQVFEFIANQIVITIQRRKMLDNLILARKKAEEAANSKQQFMSTMSHEIRTPLNEVIGISNLLYQSNPREDQMEFIKTLRFSANHLLTLVNDILDYNKMELGKIVFEKTEFDLSNLLEDTRRSYSLRAQEKGVTFRLDEPENIPHEVVGDPIRLNQILSNLLSNALKFTLTGTIGLKIRLSEMKGNKALLEFSVSDTGIGIAKDKLEEVFENYTQASSDITRKFGGTGLGLAICKRLVELQGGKIWVTSTPGKGSTFFFTLEYLVPENQPKKTENGIIDTMKGLVGKKILIAEDNKINFFVANKFLESWGVKVTHAENGSLALDALKKESFDLILMDLHMPVMDGIEATRIIRSSEDEKIRKIPIVALTAAVMSETHDKIENLYINDYVLKPFKPKDLYDRIVKHI